MKKDNFHDPYNKAIEKMRSDSMDWNFQEFLEEVESNTEVVPLESKKRAFSIRPMYGIAASLALVVAVAIGYFITTNESKEVQMANQGHSQKVKDQPALATEDNNDLEAIKSSTERESFLNSSESSDEPQIAGKSAEEQVSELLPTRGRMKRTPKERYVSNGLQQSKEKEKLLPVESKKPYDESYVIINGQKITSEKEAKDITTYSLRVLSEQMNNTIAKADATFETVEL